MKQLLLLISFLTVASVGYSQTVTSQKYELKRVGDNNYEVTVEGDLAEGQVWVYKAFSYWEGQEVDKIYSEMKNCLGAVVGGPIFTKNSTIQFSKQDTAKTFSFDCQFMELFVVGKAVDDESLTMLSVGGTLDIPAVGNKTGDAMGIFRIEADEASVAKYIENGRLVIVRNGVKYNPLGQKVY